MNRNKVAKQGMNAQPCETTIALTRCIDCACESWHAIKGSLTHRPSSQGWAPGVLPLCVCVCVCLVVCKVFGWRVCVWWFGGWFWVLSPGIYAIHMVYSCYFQKCMRHSNNHTFQIQHPDSHCFRLLHSHNNNTLVHLQYFYFLNVFTQAECRCVS